MDYVLKKCSINSVKDILDNVSQQPVDLDITLPDYCADIEKILKCSLVPQIYTRSFSAGQLRVDGASVVRILYCDSSKKALRCCEQTVPFSATIPVSEEVCEHLILTSVKPEYLNCRALTPRRLSIHGSFSLYTVIKSKCVTDVCENSAESSLQTKTESCSVCELNEFIQEQFSVSESVAVNARTAVESVVRSEVCVQLKDVMRKGDKISLSAEATLKMLYISDAVSGEVEQFVYVFPFTQTLNSKSDNLEVSDVKLHVLSYELMLSSKVVSEEPVVNLELKMSATLMGYCSKEVSFISDAFSVCDDVSLGTEVMSLCTDVLPLSTCAIIKSSVALGERKVQKILDIFCEEPVVAGEITDKKLRLSGKVNVCILAVCEDGELTCVERRVDVEAKETLQKDYSTISHPELSVTSVSYRIGDGNELLLRLDAIINTVLSDSCKISCVTAVEKIGEKSVRCNNALTLYYAHSKEKLWDIAKMYSVPVSVLCSENSIDTDELEKATMLMITNI